MDYFKILEKKDRKALEPFRYSNYIGDTSFSMLYAWGERADYRFRFYDGILAISGLIDGRRAFVLLKSSPESSVEEAVRELYGYCLNNRISLIFEDVKEEELEEYRHAALLMGKRIEYFFQDRYSDYLYKADELVSTEGRKNRTKRGGYNFIQKNYPDLQYEDFKPEMYGDCIRVFESWCAAHTCQSCIDNYGCERKAFERFMEVYDSACHKIGLVYHRGLPLAFAVCEQINHTTLSIYFQKNAERIRGLTYWLERRMILQYPDIAYVNLGEDMGIPGLAMDKNGFHPCRKLKKYTVAVI